MTYRIQKTSIDDETIQVGYLDKDNEPLSFREVVNLWASDNLFRGFHCQVLSDISFNAYRWETPVVDLNRFDRPFEFIVRNDPSLDGPENCSAFQQYFDAADEEQWIVEFPNLGGDAILVVPLPGGSHVDHCHLASFIGSCSAEHESLLWKHVGMTMLERVSDVPVWLSTAGGGVAWLHVRLDDKPKYYSHQPYKAS